MCYSMEKAVRFVAKESCLRGPPSDLLASRIARNQRKPLHKSSSSSHHPFKAIDPLPDSTSLQIITPFISQHFFVILPSLPVKVNYWMAILTEASQGVKSRPTPLVARHSKATTRPKLLGSPISSSIQPPKHLVARVMLLASVLCTVTTTYTCQHIIPPAANRSPEVPSHTSQIR